MSSKRAQPSSSSVASKRPKISPKDTDFRFPIFEHRDKLLSTITEYDLTIVIGSPGQRKSIHLPFLLLVAGVAGDGLIAVVHVNAASATYTADQLQGRLGDVVGLETRFESRGLNSRTRLRVITDGCLLREMLTDNTVLERYQVLLLDDVHLWLQQTDLLLIFLKSFVERCKQQRKALPKIVLMGSLMDSSNLLAYFPMLKSRVVFISGPSPPEHDLTCSDLASPMQSDHVEVASSATLLLHTVFKEGDALCFLASRHEAMSACFIIRKLLPPIRVPMLPPSCSPGSTPPMVVSLYKGMPRKELEKAVAPAPEGTRKIIFSDSLAENSMEIPGVKIVVDSGYCEEWFNPCLYTTRALHSGEICSAHAWYRRQRARATGSGRLYRLYAHEESPPMDTIFVQPELEQCCLAPFILFALKMGLPLTGTSFASLDFLPEEHFEAAHRELRALGAVTEEESPKLTRVGDLMVQLPLEVPLARTVVAAAELGCLAELLTISAMLNAGPIFHDYGRSGVCLMRARRHFASEHGDPVALLMVYREYRAAAARGDKRFCRRRFLNVDSLRRALRFRRRLRLCCLRLGLPVRSCGDDFNRIDTAFTTGYLFGVLRHDRAKYNGSVSHRYLSLSDVGHFLSGESALFATIPPRHIVHLESERRGAEWEITRACPADKALLRRIFPRILDRSFGAPGQGE